MLTETLANPEATETPKLAPLPNPIYPVVRVFLWLALAFVALPLVLIPFGWGTLSGGELIGGIFASSMLLAALISALTAWPVSRRLRRFRQGDFLAHWTYTEEEWLAFAEGEWERRQRDVRRAPRLGLLIGGLTGLLGGGAVGYTLSPTVLAALLGALAGTLLLGLLGGLGAWLGGCVATYTGWRRYLRMRRRVGETYIGEGSAYCDGLFWNWNMLGCSLAGMELVPGCPAVLVFNLWVSYPKGGVAKLPYRVPVPQGREEEARRILHRLCGR